MITNILELLGENEGSSEDGTAQQGRCAVTPNNTARMED